MKLSLKDLHIDGGTQPRVAIHEETVAEYAEALREGATFPPVVAFHDGIVYWLADGFHRFHAHRRAELDVIEVDVHEGMLRDAILYSVGANGDHGLRRTNEDKRKAVLTMLKDDEWSQWSDREIARRCSVTQPMVTRYRSSLKTVISENPQPESRTYTTKHGTKAKMNTSRIGQVTKARVLKSGQIARDARRPRPHNPIPTMTVTLPLNNPRKAARVMFTSFEEDYLRQLAEEVSLVLKEKEGVENGSPRN